MTKFFKKVKILFGRLSIKWTFLCIILILPMNILAVIFCAMIHGQYQEKMLEIYQKHLEDSAEELEAELDKMAEALKDCFSLEAMDTLFSLDQQDSAVLAVSLKKVMRTARMNSQARGFSFVWDKDMDLISIFNHQYPYGLSEQNQVQSQLRQIEMRSGFGSDYSFITIEGHLFLGCHYMVRQYVLGMYLDIGNLLEKYYERGIFQEGALGLLDEDGKLLCQYVAEGFQQDNELEEREKYPVFLESAKSVQTVHMVYFREKSIEGQFSWIFWLMMVLAGLSFFMFPLIYMLSNRMMIAPLKLLLTGMDKVSNGDLNSRISETGNSVDVRILNRGFNRMVMEIENLKIKVYEQEINHLKTEAINLRLQVNPHMFLNSLNTIYSLGSVGKNEQLCEFTALLSQYFRYLLRSDAEFASVKEEISFAEAYLKVQKIRFPEGFTYSFAVEEQSEQYAVPRLLVENFVENIVKYAMVPDEEIEILINVRLVDEQLIISIVDTGRGIEDETLQQIQSDNVIRDDTGNHTGIWNTRRRLNYYYGDGYQLDITSKTGKGTQVWMAIPARQNNEI